MFETVLKLVVISILVSIFAAWIKLIPKYPNWKYSFIQQLTNAVLQTVFMTLLFTFNLSSSWPVLFVVILVILWASVLFTNAMVRRNEKADWRNGRENRSALITGDGNQRAGLAGATQMPG